MIWLLACTGSASDPAQLLMESLEKPAEEALAICMQIQDEFMRGDCALDPASKLERCDELPVGVWRDECWFIVGESYRDGGLQADRVKAAETCSKAGRFANDCAYHLWQFRLGHLAGKEPRRDAAVELYCAWRPLLEWSDIDLRMPWELYRKSAMKDAKFRFGRHEVSPTEGMSATWCETLEGIEADLCRDAQDPENSLDGVPGVREDWKPGDPRLVKADPPWSCEG